MAFFPFKKKKKDQSEKAQEPSSAVRARRKSWMPALKGFHKSESWLIVEIGDEWVKLVGGTRRVGQTALSFVTADSIKDLSELDIAGLITKRLKERSFTPSRILISHPAHHLTTRILSLPSTDSKEIQDIVELQAVKQTPYTKEEITTGFRILEQDASGYSQVLLAISHRDVSSRYFRILELTGRPADQLTLSVEGVREWFEQARAKEAAEGNQRVLLLNVDWMTTDFMLFRGDRLVFTRSLSIGAKHYTEQGAALEPEFLKEVRLSIESGISELKGEAVTHVALTGVQAPLKNFMALLSRELNLPCEILSASDGWGGAMRPEARETIEAAQCSFTHLLGFARNPSEIPINLIPFDLQMRKGLETRARDLALMGTLTLALVTVLSAISFAKIYNKSAYVKNLGDEYQSIREEATEVERMVAKMKVAREQILSQGRVLEILREINEVIPDNITLTFFQFNAKDKIVTLRGTSSEMSAVFQFLSTLEATSQLESVKTRNVTRRKVKDQDLAEFEMVANVIAGGT